MYVDPAHNPDCEADDFSGSGRTIAANERGDGDDACGANQPVLPRLPAAPPPLFARFEDIIPVFTAEYLARLLTVHAALCIDSDQLIGATQSARALLRSRAGAWPQARGSSARPLEADLLAILPWWIELLMPAGSGSVGAS